MAVTGCVIAAGVPETTIRQALVALQAECRPCGADFALKQLALLRVRTKARAEDDLTLTAAAYGDWLAEYPADVAKAACEEWARGMVFWPAWSDLQKICDRLVSRRVTLRRALQKALEPAPKKLYLGKPTPETRAQRLQATIDAYLRVGHVGRAAAREKELAQEQGRSPADWALNAEMPSAITTAKDQLPALPQASEELQAMTMRDAAAFHRSQGRVKYAELLEQRAGAMPKTEADAA